MQIAHAAGAQSGATRIDGDMQERMAAARRGW
jgi:hypothetical protein